MQSLNIKKWKLLELKIGGGGGGGGGGAGRRQR